MTMLAFSNSFGLTYPKALFNFYAFMIIMIFY